MKRKPVETQGRISSTPGVNPRTHSIFKFWLLKLIIIIVIFYES